MDLQLKDKVFLVTGGSKGIGKAITLTLAEEGAIPVIFGRNPEEAAATLKTIQSHGGSGESIHVEMTDESTIVEGVRKVRDQFGRIDGVINNAGVNDGVGLESGTEAFRQSLEKNLVQVYALVHHCREALISSKGVIVNIGTKVASTGQGGTSGYAASKGGMNGLTREWAVDLAAHGVRVNCVIPAEVMTPLYERWLNTMEDPEAEKQKISKTIPLGQRFTTDQEIADTVAFVASPRSGHTTGQILYVDGGYVHLDRKCTAE